MRVARDISSRTAHRDRTIRPDDDVVGNCHEDSGTLDLARYQLTIDLRRVDPVVLFPASGVIWIFCQVVTDVPHELGDEVKRLVIGPSSSAFSRRRYSSSTWRLL